MDTTINDDLIRYTDYTDIDSARSNIGTVDFVLLMINWALVVASSVVGLGRNGGIIFILISLFLMMRNVSNTILVWLLFFFVPDVSISFQISSMFKIILILSGFVYLLNGKLGSIFRYINSLTIAVLVLIVFFTLLLPLSPNFQTASSAYIQYLQGLITLLMLLGLVNDYKDSVRILKWWAIVAALSVIPASIHLYLGYSSFLGQMWLRIMGEDAFTRILVEDVTGDFAGRLLWPGAAANGTSINLIFPLGISIGLLISERKKIFWFIIMALIYIALLGTFSRSGFLASCFMLLFYMFKKNIKAIIPAFIIGSFVILVVMLIPTVAARIFSIKENIEVSGGTGRFYLWSQAIALWLSSPIWGHGLESVLAIHLKLTHNTYIQLLAETGIIGLGLYISFIAIVAVNLLAVRKHSIEVINSGRLGDLSLGLQMGFFGVCLHLMTITYTVPMYFFWQCGLCYLFAKTIQSLEFNQGLVDESIVYNQA